MASFIGAGNGFLAMFMIGLLLEVKINPSEMKIVLKTLLIRVLFGAILMSIVYFIVPIPMLAKKIVVLAMLRLLQLFQLFFQKILVIIVMHQSISSHSTFNYYQYLLFLMSF